LARRSRKHAARRAVHDETARVLAPIPSGASLPATLDVQSLSGEFWSLENVKDFTVRTVERILAQRGVPRNDLVSPGMDITVPAMEAMRYSPLREEIAALVATTMDARHASKAHPAFLTILGQLTRDEIRMLDVMPPPDRVLPLADLYVQVTRHHTEMLYRNIVPEGLADQCEIRSRIPSYVDNLKRLELIHEPGEYALPADSVYSEITRQPFCRDIVAEKGRTRRTRVQKRVICLTDFGSTFRQVCLVQAAEG
jgi:hypothetical protein